MFVTLKQLQQEMLEAVTLADFNNGVSPKFLDYVDSTGPLQPSERLEIYSNAWFLRLTEILKNDFLSVHTQLGEELFNDVTRKYLKCYPSKSPSLFDLGEYFPDFLRDLPFKNLPIWISDLAELEALEWKSFHASRYQNFDPKKIEAMSEEEKLLIPLVLSDSVYFLESDYDLYSVWNEPEKKEPEEKRQYLMIYRYGIEVNVDVLDFNTWKFLKSLKTPTTLQNFLENSATIDGATHLQTWISKQILTIGA